MGLLSNISEFFASNTYVQATEHSITSKRVRELLLRNELENSIEDLNGRYKLGHTTLIMGLLQNISEFFASNTYVSYRAFYCNKRVRELLKTLSRTYYTW